MKLFKIYFMSAIVPLLFINGTFKKPLEHSLHGVVANKETGKPLADIYLFTVKGEEEAVTNKNGQFKFTSWQKLPVTLHVQHKENEHIRVVISNPAEDIKIKL